MKQLQPQSSNLEFKSEFQYQYAHVFAGNARALAAAVAGHAAAINSAAMHVPIRTGPVYDSTCPGKAVQVLYTGLAFRRPAEVPPERVPLPACLIRLLA